MTHLRKKVTSEFSFAISLPIHNWTPQLKAVLGSLKTQNVDVQIAVMMTGDDPRVHSDLDNSGLTFHYMRKGPDMGQAAAIAEGWNNTDSPIIGWLNTDDALTEKALAETAALFEADSNLDVVYGHSTISDEANAIWGLHPSVQPIGSLLQRTNIISQPSCFYRRRAVDAIGGINEKLQYTMDWDLWLRLFENEARFEFTEQILSNVTWAQDTKTAVLSKQRLFEFTKVLRRSQSLFKTGVGISALIRNNMSTYKSHKSVESNCLTVIASKQSETIPVINMHANPKQELHITHDAKPFKIRSLGRPCELVSNTEKSILTFRTPLAPGESAVLKLEGQQTKLKSFSWC